MLRPILAALVLLWLGVVNQLHAQEDPQLLHQRATNAAVARISDSVLQIETIGGLSRVGELRTNSAPTSAVVVDADGYAITSSFNFIQQPASIIAKLPDGTRVPAEVVAKDIGRKLTLLKLDTDQKLRVPAVAERERLDVGQTAVAVGKVYSHVDANISVGIISATHRIWDRAVQTDAKISPANFGGPLIDLQGRVIGILTPMSPNDNDVVAGAEWYDSGIGFAAPFTDVLSKLDQLKNGNDLRPGLLGATFEGGDIYASKATVASARKNLPAGKAGIEVGDVVTKINDRTIRRMAELRHALGGLYEGDLAAIKVQRGDEELEFQIELAGQLPAHQPIALGVVPGFRPSTQAPNQVDANDDQRLAGVTVRQVIPESAASIAGISRGDRIVEIEDQKVNSAAEIRSALNPFSIGEAVNLKIAVANAAANANAENEGGEPLAKAETKRVVLKAQSSNVVSIEKFELPESLDDVKAVDVKIPEVSNQCFAVVPPKRSGQLPALLVWLSEPGSINQDKFLKANRQRCAEHNVILLVPQSKDKARWDSTEAEFVVKATDTLGRTVSFDRTRVSIGGQGTGGVMAGIVCAGQRGLFRGLILLDTTLPRVARGLKTSPVQPLLIFVATTGQFGSEKRLRVEVDQLRSRHVPIETRYNDGSVGDHQSFGIGSVLLQWSRSVNRM